MSAETGDLTFADRWCSVCSEPFVSGVEITMLWDGDVQEVCSTTCARGVLEMWTESRHWPVGAA